MILFNLLYQSNHISTKLYSIAYSRLYLTVDNLFHIFLFINLQITTKLLTTDYFPLEFAIDTVKVLLAKGRPAAALEIFKVIHKYQKQNDHLSSFPVYAAAGGLVSHFVVYIYYIIQAFPQFCFCYSFTLSAVWFIREAYCSEHQHKLQIEVKATYSNLSTYD